VRVFGGLRSDFGPLKVVRRAALMAYSRLRIALIIEWASGLSPHRCLTSKFVLRVCLSQTTQAGSLSAGFTQHDNILQLKTNLAEVGSVWESLAPRSALLICLLLVHVRLQLQYYSSTSLSLPATVTQRGKSCSLRHRVASHPRTSLVPAHKVHLWLSCQLRHCAAFHSQLLSRLIGCGAE
jgi:hypothetical protein